MIHLVWCWRRGGEMDDGMKIMKEKEDGGERREGGGREGGGREGGG